MLAPEGDVETRASKARVSTSPERPSFDRYYSDRNNLEIVSKSLFSIVCRMATMLALLGGILITPFSGHTETSQWHHKITLATVRVLSDDVKFYDGPGILHAKSRIHALTARELPC